MEKISAFLILYNDEKLVERALKSIEGVVDEILVFHDGPCNDATLKIAKKYTKNIYILPHKGRASLHLITVFKKAKYDWLLKIDADELLSPALRKNIKILAQNPKADAYSFIWRWYDGSKFITKAYPRKMALFRKSKVSFLEFPGNDEPETTGNLIYSNLEFIHKPGFNNFTWEKAFTKGNSRAKDQAIWTLKDFNKLKKNQYHRTDFKKTIKLRRNHPILSIFIFPLAAFIKIMLSGWKEGFPVFDFAIKDAYYQFMVLYYLNKLKYRKYLKK